MKQRAHLGFGLLAVLLGLLLSLDALRRALTWRLPPEIAGTLSPIEEPKTVNLGSLKGPNVGEGRISESEGLALINASLDASLFEYGRLTDTKVVRPRGLTNIVVNFRGQDRPRVLALQLAKSLRASGIVCVALGGRVAAAVPADIRLLWGWPEFSTGPSVRFAIGATLVLGGCLWVCQRKTGGPPDHVPHLRAKVGEDLGEKLVRARHWARDRTN